MSVDYEAMTKEELIARDKRWKQGSTNQAEKIFMLEQSLAELRNMVGEKLDAEQKRSFNIKLIASSTIDALNNDLKKQDKRIRLQEKTIEQLKKAEKVPSVNRIPRKIARKSHPAISNELPVHML